MANERGELWFSYDRIVQADGTGPGMRGRYLRDRVFPKEKRSQRLTSTPRASA